MVNDNPVIVLDDMDDKGRSLFLSSGRTYDKNNLDSLAQQIAMKMCEYQLKKNIKGILELQSSQEQERKSLEEKNKLIMEHYKSLYKKDLPNINAYWEHTTQEAAKELAINVEKYTNDVLQNFIKSLITKKFLLIQQQILISS